MPALRYWAVGLWLALPTTTLAHADGPLAPHDLWAAWTLEPQLLGALLACDVVYWLGTYRLWRRAGFGRGMRPWQAAAFAGACLALLVALVSPLDALGGVLLSAHMAQHMVLILLAAPLLALSDFPMAALWALPRAWRRSIGAVWQRSRALKALWRTLTQPLVAWSIATGVLWAWHSRGLYQAALENETIHTVEHLAFLFTAILFWWGISQPGATRFCALWHRRAVRVCQRFAGRRAGEP